MSSITGYDLTECQEDILQLRNNAAKNRDNIENCLVQQKEKNDNELNAFKEHITFKKLHLKEILKRDYECIENANVDNWEKKILCINDVSNK